jgi:flagellar hook-associated protein 3 FlgL
MRITQTMLTNNFLMNLNQSMSRLEKLQNQLSTGKKVNLPSDDPVVAVRSIQYNSQIKELQQYMRNADTAIKWMETTDSTLQEANNLFKTIREKLVQGSSETLNEESRLAIAKEMEQLKQHLGSIANTSIAGRFIFAGTETQTPPYDDATGTFINTNTSKISVEMGKDIFIEMNVNGTEIFAYKDKSGKNIFELMDTIVNTLKDPNGKPSQLLSELQEHEDNFLKVHTALGARQNRVELIKSRLEEQVVTTTKILSNEEDADLAKVITDLNMAENVHRMALGTGARIMQPTLMDFLR